MFNTDNFFKSNKLIGNSRILQYKIFIRTKLNVIIMNIT